MRNATRGSGGDAAAAADAAATGPAVGRLVATAKGTYDAETANDLKRVKSDAGGLSQKVGDAWGQDKKIAGQAGLLDKLNAARDAAAKLHLAPVAALGAPPTAATATAAATPAPEPPRPGILVLDGARRMKQFHDDLSTRLDGVLDEAADEALKAAKEESEEAKEKLKAAEAQHTKDAQAVTDNQKGITGWEAKQKENELKPDDKKVLQDEIDTLTKEKPKLSGRAAASKRAAEEQAAKVKELTTKAERPVGDFRKELEPIVKEARKLARQAVGGAVRPLVERREQVLNQYEIELDLVGRSVAAP